MPLSAFSAPLRVYILAVAALFGLVMGSALNCLAYRLARNEKWSGGRSVCPVCGHTLKAVDLVPLFSWLFLRGRCRYCRAPISPRYPVTELCLGLCFTASVLRFGFCLHTASVLVLCACLFCLSLVDLDVQIIPDRFLIIPAVVRLAELFWQGSWRGLLHGILPALGMGAGILLIVLIMDRLFRRESMGGGDIKLFAMLGLWLSFPGCLLLLFLSCLFGLAFAAAKVRMKRSIPFAFGPAISAAAFAVLLAGEPIVNWYMGLFM